jgi:uncharacterized membrane protein YbaN (DUF454 family)
MRVATALILLCVGLVLLFLPLVYIPFLLISAALFASESRYIAQTLDRIESWSRTCWDEFKAKFGISKRGATMIVGSFGLLSLALAGVTCLNTFFR